MDEHLSWSVHISRLSQSIFPMLRVFWLLTNFADTNFRMRMFKAFLLPKFLYGDIVMYGMTEGNKNKIRRIFNACVRYVFKLRKFDHISPYANRLLNTNFNIYMDLRVCLFLYKLLKSRTPKYLYEMLRVATSSRTLNLVVPFSRKNILNKSFYVHGVVLWNSLPIAIRRSGTQLQFKTNFLQHFS